MNEILYIEDIYDNVNTLIPNNIPSFIQSTEWWELFKDYFDDLLLQNKGGYPINLPRLKDYSDLSKIAIEIGRIIRLHLVSHFYEYNGLYITTQLEYNPIWNVDGTVITEGNRQNDGSSSAERKVNNTSESSGEDVNTASGTDVDTLSGEDILKKRGTFTVSEHISHSETPMDAQTLLLNYKDEKSTTTSYDTPEDTTVYGKIDSVKYGKVDTVKYGNTVTDNTKDDLKNVSTNDEVYNETVTRQGNIGVTMTQQLIEAERNVVNFSWLEYVVNDIAPRFTLTGGVYSI